MNEKLVQMVQLHLNHYKELSKFVNTVATEVLKAVEQDEEEDHDKLKQFLSAIINMNGSLYKYASSSEEIAIKPELLMEALSKINGAAVACVKGFAACKQMVDQDEIKSYFDKASNELMNIFGLTNDLARTYLVNIDEELLDEYLISISNEHSSYVNLALNYSLSKNKDDKYSQEIINKIEKLKMFEEQQNQENEKLDNKHI